MIRHQSEPAAPGNKLDEISFPTTSWGRSALILNLAGEQLGISSDFWGFCPFSLGERMEGTPDDLGATHIVYPSGISMPIAAWFERFTSEDCEAVFDDIVAAAHPILSNSFDEWIARRVELDGKGKQNISELLEIHIGKLRRDLAQSGALDGKSITEITDLVSFRAQRTLSALLDKGIMDPAIAKLFISSLRRFGESGALAIYDCLVFRGPNEKQRYWPHRSPSAAFEALGIVYQSEGKYSDKNIGPGWDGKNTSDDVLARLCLSFSSHNPVPTIANVFTYLSQNGLLSTVQMKFDSSPGNRGDSGLIYFNKHSVHGLQGLAEHLENTVGDDLQNPPPVIARAVSERVRGLTVIPGEHTFERVYWDRMGVPNSITQQVTGLFLIALRAGYGASADRVNLTAARAAFPQLLAAAHLARG